MMTLFLLAGFGAGIGALAGMLLGEGSTFLGACAGLIVSVLVWIAVIMMAGHAKPVRLEEMESEWAALEMASSRK